MTDDRRIPSIERGPAFEFEFEGQKVTAHPGESVAMALWASGLDVLRHSSRDGAGRAVLCNMGICYECLVRIDGAVVRACTTEARPGLVVHRGGKP